MVNRITSALSRLLRARLVSFFKAVHPSTSFTDKSASLVYHTLCLRASIIFRHKSGRTAPARKNTETLWLFRACKKPGILPGQRIRPIGARELFPDLQCFHLREHQPLLILPFSSAIRACPAHNRRGCGGARKQIVAGEAKIPVDHAGIDQTIANSL